MTDRDAVAAQYATPDRLRTRMAIWRPGPEGVSPRDVARAVIVALHPGRILEVGCGTGELAAQLVAALPECDYLATDLSPSMVATTAALGVSAAVVDATWLPFAEASFDVVLAAWMLYHVPDLHATLREVRRVLRPGGTFVAVTNGEQHLAALLREAGGAPLLTQFTSENGQAVLHRHFENVTRRDVQTRAWFVDHAAAVECLASFDADLASRLPVFSGAREYAGSTTVFCAG